MNETDIRQALELALWGEDLEEALGDTAPRDIRSFGDAGVLTRNEGLVLRLSDGSEFQITVVQSR
jgi:hypothetical protein